ncbi:hypothetical protein CKAN_02095400 [Cinnamomum micranthum f. kanehirae]|uniref:Uncharacterized protein n=1 Tax=Cinnamomum micranthum f. kanehirae TaxID=337451 RepID=A0A443PLZ0_9MAGN|nr:hypothetical protein CKAN_02095400 [Cinnamomum micranthum f. kanehirae]
MAFAKGFGIPLSTLPSNCQRVGPSLDRRNEQTILQKRANHGFVNDLDAKPGADNDNDNSSMSSLNHRSPSITLFYITARFSHPKIVDNHNPQFMATSLSPQKTRSCSTATIDWRYIGATFGA